MSGYGDEDRVWPDRWVDVEIVTLDGEVLTHTIKAGLGITNYLASQAGHTGQLVLLCQGETVCYPVDNIRSWRLHNERDQK